MIAYSTLRIRCLSAVATVLAFCVCSTAHALPSSPIIEGKPWQQVGRGAYSVLLFTAYDIALYAPQGAYNSNKPHALAIQYRMNFSSDEIIDRSIEEMERSKPLPEADERAYRSSLKRVIPNVADGDIVQAVFVPGSHTIFSKNGKVSGTINGAAFTKAYAGIWLAPDTNAPSLRESLLSR